MRYDILSKAAAFYSARGYAYYDEAPWAVGEKAYYATKPAEAKDVSINASEFLVASGEQSFLQMMLDDRHIKKGFCITPCFRIEEKYTKWKLPYFMKLELINADDPTLGNLIHLVRDAADFFENFTEVRIVETSDPRGQRPTFDIVDKKGRHELGSYGIRNLILPDRAPIAWIYGTGVAEPRLSMVLEQQVEFEVTVSNKVSSKIR